MRARRRAERQLAGLRFTGYRRVGPVSVSYSAGSINHPYVTWLWEGAPEAFLSLSWGNGNSDPVWSVAVRLPVPRRYWSDRARRWDEDRHMARPG